MCGHERHFAVDAAARPPRAKLRRRARHRGQLPPGGSNTGYFSSIYLKIVTKNEVGRQASSRWALVSNYGDGGLLAF
jgi:hypothetical protein